MSLYKNSQPPSFPRMREFLADWLLYLISGSRLSPSAALPHGRGFTLIELCIVLIILGMMTSFSMLPARLSMSRHALEDTRTNMDAAQSALNVFFEMNGYYPCPAARGLTPDKEAFGKAEEGCFSGGEGGKKAGAGGRDKGTQSVEGRDGKRVRIGILPFRSLGLTDAQGADGWNRLLQYAVTEELTDPAWFDQRGGAIDVVAEDKKSRVQPPATVQYVILSTGETGTGGFGAGGAQAAECETNIRESENCDDDAVFMDSLLYQGGKKRGRRDGQPQEFFDDHVRYVQYNTAINEKNGLLFYYKGACPPYFREVPDVPDDLDIQVLEYRAETGSGSTVSNPQSRVDSRKRLCFSPRYGMHFLRLDLGGKSSQCPKNWTHLGYVWTDDGSYNDDGGMYTPLHYKICAI